MPSAASSLVRARSTARAVRWLVLAAIAMAAVVLAYVRITASFAPDLSTLPFDAFGAASDSPICQERPEAPNLTDEVVGPHFLHVTRAASKAESGSAPRLRESAPLGDRLEGPAATALRASRISTAAFIDASPSWESPRRTRARLMVFLN